MVSKQYSSLLWLCQFFSKIHPRLPTPLTSMLKITLVAWRCTNVIRSMRISDGEMNNGDTVREMGKNLFKINPFRVCFLAPKASIVFTCFKKAFTKTSILHYFDREHDIEIEMYASSFVICGIFRQPNLVYMTHTNSDFSFPEISEGYLLVFFSKKRISAKTRYKSSVKELLTIFEAFKT